MADVEALCRRVVVIHHGRLLFDGELTRLLGRFSEHKTMAVQLADSQADVSGYGEVVEQRDGRATLRVPKADTASVTARLLAEQEVIDLTVEDPPLEEVIDRVFAQGSATAHGGRVRGLAGVYAQQFRTTLAVQLQYRGALSIWLIGQILEPLIALAVWSAVSRSSAGAVSGYTAPQFAAYFIVLMLVNHLTFTWIMFEFEYRVRHGSLSFALLRPAAPHPPRHRGQHLLQAHHHAADAGGGRVPGAALSAHVLDRSLGGPGLHPFPGARRNPSGSSSSGRCPWRSSGPRG